MSTTAWLAEFRQRYPEGSLQPADPSRPFQVVDVCGRVFLAYTAAAYRAPEDPRPGIGVAWCQVSNAGQGGELERAEAGAWARAIAALGVDQPTPAAAPAEASDEGRNREPAAAPAVLDAKRMRAEQEEATATRNGRGGWRPPTGDPPAARGGDPPASPRRRDSGRSVGPDGGPPHEERPAEGDQGGPEGERRVRDLLRDRGLDAARVLKALNRQTSAFRGVSIPRFLDLTGDPVGRVEAYLDAGALEEAGGQAGEGAA